MSNERIQKAYDEFMIELFGEVPKDVSLMTVSRSGYTKAMQDVQTKYSIKQGDPDFIEWLFTLIGRSPMIIEDEETTEERAMK